jgi:hypothetical protein
MRRILADRVGELGQDRGAQRFRGDRRHTLPSSRGAVAPRLK